jgi:cell division protease FtsH
MVIRLPEGDRISVSRDKLLADIRVAMGGRIAEEIIFGHGNVTTGASSDIKMATSVAQRMITEWGLNDKLGFRAYSNGDENYLGQSTGGGKSYSEDTAKRVDAEINEVLNKCYEQAEKLLKDKEPLLHKLAGLLLERETLTGDEIKIILEGGELPLMVEEIEEHKRSTVPTS